MDHQAQVNAVKQALGLSVRIDGIQKQLFSVMQQKYSPKPTPPTLRQISAPVYPEIKTQIPFWTKELLPALIFWPWIIIWYFTGYKKKVDAEKERIRNTPEYRRQCAEINAAKQREKDAADAQYQHELTEYNEITLPRYEKAFSEWQKKHQAEISALQADLKDTQNALAEHYEATKIVPLPYRQINALQYIYDMISTSEYTIVQAISSYDQKVQQHIGVQQLHVQQATYVEQRRTADAAERGADAAERSADAAERRADAVEHTTHPNRSHGETTEKKDYYLSSGCIRRGLNGKNTCAGCTLAPYCTHCR